MYKASYISEGKTTYWVRGQRFINEQGQRNGKKIAMQCCLLNGIAYEEILTFDSQLECDRWEYLLNEQKLGNISNLTHHQKLPILKGYINNNGDEIPPLEYNADFVYWENGKLIVEDVKGASLFQDTRFEAVKQMFDYVYNGKTYIRIIIRRDHQWIEWKLGDRKKPQKLIKKQSNKIKELQKQLHQKEIEENKKQREIDRLNELRSIEKLTSAQRKRLNELEQKYSMGVSK